MITIRENKALQAATPPPLPQETPRLTIIELKSRQLELERQIVVAQTEINSLTVEANPPELVEPRFSLNLIRRRANIAKKERELHELVAELEEVRTAINRSEREAVQEQAAQAQQEARILEQEILEALPSFAAAMTAFEHECVRQEGFRRRMHQLDERYRASRLGLPLTSSVRDAVFFAWAEITAAAVRQRLPLIKKCVALPENTAELARQMEARLKEADVQRAREEQRADDARSHFNYWEAFLRMPDKWFPFNFR